MLPGVQALFAFLLIVPFNERVASAWPCLPRRSRASCSSPPLRSTRRRFRRHDKAQLVRFATGSRVAGMATLAVAMIAAVFLVTEILFGDRMAGLLTAGIAIPIGLLWWVVPAVFGTDRAEQTASSGSNS